MRRLRGPADHEIADLRSYRRGLAPVIVRLGAIRDGWIELSQHQQDATRLANAAATYRWEIGRMSEAVQALDPPRWAADLQRDVEKSMTEASRACHLLATGHRFSKWDLICDGHALLLQVVDHLERGLREVDRALGEDR